MKASGSAKPMKMEKAELKAILYSGYFITIFGIFGNSLSLYYFLSQATSNSQPRNTDTSTTNLFVMLNCFDLLVSISGFARHFDPEDENDVFLEFFKAIFLVSGSLTYFVTCLLSVRRLINLIWPLYLVKRKPLNIAIAIFSFIVVAMEIIWWTLYEFGKEGAANFVDSIRCLIRILLICIIIASSLISFVKLDQTYTQDQHRRTRYATITVGILSAIFCVCNALPLVVSGISAFHPEGDKSIPRIVVSLVILVLVPLNSACNPVVYITRRADMRTFLTTKCRGVIRYCKCGSEDTAGRSEAEVHRNGSITRDQRVS